MNKEAKKSFVHLSNAFSLVQQSGNTG